MRSKRSFIQWVDGDVIDSLISKDHSSRFTVHAAGKTDIRRAWISAENITSTRQLSIPTYQTSKFLSASFGTNTIIPTSEWILSK